MSSEKVAVTKLAAGASAQTTHRVGIYPVTVGRPHTHVSTTMGQHKTIWLCTARLTPACNDVMLALIHDAVGVAQPRKTSRARARS